LNLPVVTRYAPIRGVFRVQRATLSAPGCGGSDALFRRRVYYPGMDEKGFEQLVEDAVAALPERLRGAMDNVGIVIEREVRRKKAGEVGIKVGEVLLGLYEGVPLDHRGPNYFGVAPDKITIFRGTIEQMAEDDSDLAELVKDVVWHEIGHHFGFDEDELRRLERKRRRRKQRIFTH